VDGTVDTGCENDNLYALDADVEGSRVSLRTLGHHNAWAGKRLPESGLMGASGEDNGTNSGDQSESSGTGPGLGVGSAIAALTSAGYALHRRREQ
jgi:PGF-CTERM protein